MQVGAFRLPPGLADGFGLKGFSPTRCREIHPTVVGPPFRDGFGSPASSREVDRAMRPKFVTPVTGYHVIHRCQGVGEYL
jgi:hypothetical protein